MAGRTQMSDAWLDAQQLSVWVRLKAVLELLPSALDSQLRREAEVTLFEYYVLAMLSEAEDRTLRMSALAARTNATLPRLSHVVRKMADRGLVRRAPDPRDGRAIQVHLTGTGYDALVAAAPGHVASVRGLVFDQLQREQVVELGAIADAMLQRLDPDGVLTHEYRCPPGA